MIEKEKNIKIKIIQRVLQRIGIQDTSLSGVDFEEGLSENEITNLIYLRDALNLCRNQMKYHLWKTKARFSGRDIFGDAWIRSVMDGTREEYPELKSFFELMVESNYLDVYLYLVHVNHALELFYTLTADVNLD